MRRKHSILQFRLNLKVNLVISDSGTLYFPGDFGNRRPAIDGVPDKFVGTVTVMIGLRRA